MQVDTGTYVVGNDAKPFSQLRCSAHSPHVQVPVLLGQTLNDDSGEDVVVQWEVKGRGKVQ